MQYLKTSLKDIKKAANILKEGGIGAFPTETVYGLGADALDYRAVARIFEAKKRPVFDPLIVHVADFKAFAEICETVPKSVEKLAKRFCPGPLTFILKKKEIIPDLVTSGFDTVAVRIPSHPIAQKLLQVFGRPIAAPSANRFGSISATSAQDVMQELPTEVDFVIDGGHATIGLESTIIQLTPSHCKILRPGGVALEELKKALPKMRVTKAKAPASTAPGQLDMHYATDTPLVYMQSTMKASRKFLEDLLDRKLKRVNQKLRLALLTLEPCSAVKGFAKSYHLDSKGDLVRSASALFHMMRLIDQEKFDLIVVEKMPLDGLGLAMDDRLKRAAVAEHVDLVIKKVAR